MFKYKEREYLNRNEISDIGELSLVLLLSSEYELLDSLSYDGIPKDDDKQKFVITKLIRSMILCNYT